MSVLFAELTRDQIAERSADGVALLPTASIEQHGPHLAVSTDTVLCGTVAQRAAERAAGDADVIVAPVLCFGNSHHHYPFAGVLSLQSQNYVAAVTDVLDGMVRSGFRKLILLNGHGGNTDANGMIALDIVNRHGYDVRIAAAPYWDIARKALVEGEFLPSGRIPGHAGRFETALMRAIRPDLVDEEGIGRTEDQARQDGQIFAPLAGATVQTHGSWAAGSGYTDNPAAATREEGEAMLAVIVEQVAAFMTAFASMG